MPRRRNPDLWDDLFDVLESIFSVVTPWTSIPVAAVGYLLISMLVWTLTPELTGPAASMKDFLSFFGP